MTRYAVIVADPPWSFGDQLRMSSTPRGAAANYPTLDLREIARLPVSEVAAGNAVLALWVPSAMLADGLLVARAWGFEQKQVFTWVKTAGGPSGLAFGMGRLFRGCTEHALICKRGRVEPADRAQRNVELAAAMPHSKKPETLQDRLEVMVPDGPFLELFARRRREGWTCVGNEIDGLDIREWFVAAGSSRPEGPTAGREGNP